MDDEVIYKQALLLEQRYKLLDSIRDANRILDEKSNTLLQIGGAIVGLVATFSVSGLAQLLRGQGPAGIPVVSQIFLIGTFVLYLISVLFFRQVYVPRSYALPGSDDWDKALSKYLDVGAEKCFDQILDDLLTAVSLLRELNLEKSKNLEWQFWFFLAQITALAFAVGFA